MGMRTLFRRHVAVPNDHGSWVFLISPLLIGLAAGGTWKTESLYLVIAAFAGFLIRQPLVIAVKIASGRRGAADRPAALFWTAVYAAIAGLMVAGLVLRGHGVVLWLAVSGAPVFLYHLWLVSRRDERRQTGVMLAATAVLALAAPAALWVGVGYPDPIGWLLWALCWAQSAASIVYVHLRLEQRGWRELPSRRDRLRAALPAFRVATFNLVAVLLLIRFELAPHLLYTAYLVQWLEVIYGALRPAMGARPAALGMRQLAVSTLFTVLFIVAWWT